ncbi:hypothetical protein LVW04_08820, partial [Klebsiella pneumoniae]|nr:hypothetical protein [Klebsiella pneumoniae]
KSAQIREILISESAWEEMTCLFAPSLVQPESPFPRPDKNSGVAFVPGGGCALPGLQSVRPVVNFFTAVAETRCSRSQHH